MLTDAIASICTGDVRPRELIVVINAQSARERAADRTAARTTFARFDRSGIDFRLMECDTVGPGPARNAGARVAGQPWLAFLDSDDLWEPDKLQRQLLFLAQRPHLNACHTAETWIKDGRVLQQPAHLRANTGRFLRASFGHCLISCSSILMRRATFFELGEFDPEFRVCEDFELWLRYLARYPIGLLPEPLTRKQAGDWPQESRRFHSLDAYRIRAHLKLVRIDRSLLNADDLAAARLACETKLNILLTGARKHSTPETFELLAEEMDSVFEAAKRLTRATNASTTFG